MIVCAEPDASVVKRAARHRRLIPVRCDVRRVRLQHRGVGLVRLAAGGERGRDVHAGPGELELRHAPARGHVAEVLRDRPERDGRPNVDLVLTRCQRGDGLAAVVDDAERAVHRVVDVDRRQNRAPGGRRPRRGVRRAQPPTTITNQISCVDEASCAYSPRKSRTMQPMYSSFGRRRPNGFRRCEEPPGAGPRPAPGRA